ncbi:CBU_0592 family membrane protein [Pseudoruegeria sp. SHC-113]|uniref:CBU_0592 family membrane protein n=1 Tax=Pseudoruegeria sp. SHC-113 TaxID=2855439 RepID=UPI0021BB2D47|nr:hypothetical protein [Pseudoruegeria sp. SHC-113]MCT8160919.1 hypothetical protein [Pseudoruegeria sp. SHC-113]
MTAIQTFVQALQIFPAGFSAGLGILGVGLYIGNYVLIALNRVDSRAVGYFLVNTLAASCVLISLSREFNFASALIQLFWISLGLLAIAVRMGRSARAYKGVQAHAACRRPLPACCRRRARRRAPVPRVHVSPLRGPKAKGAKGLTLPLQ